MFCDKEKLKNNNIKILIRKNKFTKFKKSEFFI